MHFAMNSLACPRSSARAMATRAWQIKLPKSYVHTVLNRRVAVHCAKSSDSIGAAKELRPVMMTCRRCKQQFDATQNKKDSCRFHPAIYSGGEVAKALGFVRQSDAPEHQLAVVMGRTGLLRFWDCCGKEDEAHPGCETGYHLSFDSEVNEKYGWE